MDFHSLYQFVIDYLSEYFMILLAIVRNPIIYFSPLPYTSRSEISLSITNKDFAPKNYRLSPKLFTYILISILLGSTVNALIPDRIDAPNLQTIFIVLLLFWITYSTLVHVVCKSLKGQGKYIQTLSITLQLTSTFYVLSSFAAFMMSIITQVDLIYRFLSDNGGVFKALANNPAQYFFGIQFILLFIYVPIALKRIHMFPWQEIVHMGFMSFLLFILSFFLFGIVTLVFVLLRHEGYNLGGAMIPGICIKLKSSALL